LADFLWTGGIWAFYDVEAALRGLARRKSNGEPTTLAFLHAVPDPDNAPLLATIEALVDQLGLRDLVTMISEPIDMGDRDGFLRGARGVVAIAQPGVENDTCVRLRTRDSLLYGLPVLVDDFGGTGAFVRQHKIGVALASTDATSVAAGFGAIADVGPARAEMLRRLTVVAEEQAYDVTVPAWLRSL
jgi:hypothetical protein